MVAKCFGSGWTPKMLVMLRMTPRCPFWGLGVCASITSKASRHMRYWVVTLVAKTMRQPSSVHSCSGASPNARALMPATLNRPSKRPKSLTHFLMAAGATLGSVKSPTWEPVFAPRRSNSVCKSATCSAVRLTINRLFPKSASWRAVSAPIPVEPVIR